eukprot:1202299-Rhodomonas_salina.1
MSGTDRYRQTGMSAHSERDTDAVIGTDRLAYQQRHSRASGTKILSRQWYKDTLVSAVRKYSRVSGIKILSCQWFKYTLVVQTCPRPQPHTGTAGPGKVDFSGFDYRI